MNKLQSLLKDLEFVEGEYADARSNLDSVKYEIGEQLRETRKEKGLSLRVVASKAGVAAPTLYDVELGRRFLSREKLDKIVKFLSK